MNKESGSAMLTALGVVALVATIGSGAMSWQNRLLEVEAYERERLQANWLLSSAYHWSRLLLRQDAQGSSIDHLAEPWAIPLQETSITAFVASNKGVIDADLPIDQRHTLIAGRMVDEHSKINLLNAGYGKDGDDIRQLFELLQLPTAEADNIIRVAKESLSASQYSDKPLAPTKLIDFAWHGVSQSTLHKIAPYSTLIRANTSINVNTAPATVIQAAAPKLSKEQVQRIIHERQTKPFETVFDVYARLRINLPEEKFTTSSNYYSVSGKLKTRNISLNTTATIKRVGENSETIMFSTNSSI